MAKIFDVDLLAGLGAGAYALVAKLWVAQLETLVSAEVAGGFALIALARWYGRNRRKAVPAKTDGDG